MFLELSSVIADLWVLFSELKTKTVQLLGMGSNHKLYGMTFYKDTQKQYNEYLEIAKGPVFYYSYCYHSC